MKSNKTLSFPKRKITHLTTEEVIYNEFVKKGLIKIDSQGRIWRKAQGKHSARGWIRAETISTNNRGTDGQIQSQVRVSINQMKISCTSSRLVWLALKGRIPHLKVVSTKNGDKSDTRPKNLFLCTHRESLELAYQRAA